MKHKCLILLIFLIALPASAADGLGRLFLTPDQRAQLEVTRARRDQRQPAVAEPEPAAAAPVPQGPETVTYSGLVRRSDGKSTVWINGKPVDERSRMRGGSDINVLGMRADGAVSVAIPQAARTASLKVGQSLDVNSGRVEESYSRRATVSRTTGSTPLTPVPAQAPLVNNTDRPPRLLRESFLKDADREGSAKPAERATKE